MTTLRVLRRRVGGLAILLFVASGGMAVAQDKTVAIVEDTSGNIVGVEPLDLLRTGREIVLTAQSGLIVSYLNSCQRENIRGGKVVIGEVQSDVQGGEVSRRRVPCDAAALNLTPEQANQSATLVFRDPPKEKGINFLLNTRQPIVIAPGLAEVKLEQLEKVKSTRVVKVAKGIADLTAEHGLLDQGGLYQLTAGDRTVKFRVGKEATDNPMPILQRAIRL
ncbi:MAG: hypothetical protein HYU58_21430 [Proteobacteria bacterium]|nr:hypothetical protein [Pseudomonadota bacterium]